jgi:NAD(P)-dependent dehydrogenase (short-subunit alcohol dehydrogenase family)
MRIQGHTFLVSGGGSGLGAGTARQLVGGGGRVVIADVNAAMGQALAEELGPAARFVRMDVTNAAEVHVAVDAAVQLSEGDGLRGAVSCAGIAPAERIVGKEGQPHSLELFQQVLAVNLVGTFNVLRIGAAAMAKNTPLDDGERGVIINTASIAAFEGQVGQAAYSASKGGVVSMTLPIARELARHGIRTLTIAPGGFETPLIAGIADKVRQSLMAAVPFPPRFGRPQEYAALVAHIIENIMLNGSTIRIDGAMRMG